MRTDSLGPPKLVTLKGKVATLACGQASKQAWPNSSRYKRRGQCRSRMRRGDPSARQTRQPDLQQSIRLMQSATHTARLPVSRPAWMTYRIGMALARRGYLTLASSRPSQLAGFLSSHMALVVEIYKGTAGTGLFGSRKYSPISLLSVPTSSSSRLAVRCQLLELEIC